MTKPTPKSDGGTVYTVEVRKPKPRKCIRCKDKAEDGIVDYQGRFWCEDCALFALGDIDP